MGDDPNSDLIGHKLTIEGCLHTVTGTTTWSSEYVNVETTWGRKGCLQAEYVRAAKRSETA